MFDEIKDGEKSAAPELPDSFLIDWGFDLLSAFRSIKSDTLRRSIISLIAAAAEAERAAANVG